MLPPPARQRRPRTAAAVRFGLLVVLVASLGALTLYTRPSRETLVAAVALGDAFAPLMAVFGSAVLIAVLTPRTLLAFVGGALFGTGPGAGYVLIGVAAGASLAFTIGRLLGRDFVASRLRGRFALIEGAVSRRGLVAVVVARLIPLVPFGISNYVFGTTAVRRRSFLLGTLIGAAPATIAYAALGSATMRGTPADKAIAGIAVATIAVGGAIGTFLVWRRRPKRTPAPAVASEPKVLVAATAE